MIKELYIYRNGQLHCIISDEEAEETLSLLQQCFPLEDFELLEKPKKGGGQ